MLLARIEQKDEEALAAFYDRYSGLVYSEAKRILQRAGEAEEILQDVFYCVWQKAQRFEPARGSLAGWLLVAARKRAVAKLRRRNWKSEALDEHRVELPVNVESHAAQNLLIEKVRRELTGLGDGQREAMEYAYFEGMSNAEISSKTGTPLGTVKARIRDGMEALKRQALS